MVIRVDGKAFHTFTRDLVKPFSVQFQLCMMDVARNLCKEIQSAVCAYVQSDEISILLHPYKRLESQPWYSNNLQKMVSVTAGMASAHFTQGWGKVVVFDGRAFVLPEEEVVNYFIWRQQDAERNSISMVAQSLYMPRELHGKKFADLKEMLLAKEWDWDSLPALQKRGVCVIKSGGEWHTDKDIPRFAESWDYIRSLLATEDQD